MFQKFGTGDDDLYFMHFWVKEEANFPNPIVRIYNDASYEGPQKYFFTEGVFQGSHMLPIHNDQISSIKVAAGYEVVIYTEADLKGKGMVVKNDIPVLDDYGFNDNVSSIQIRRIVQ